MQSGPERMERQCHSSQGVCIGVVEAAATLAACGSSTGSCQSPTTFSFKNSSGYPGLPESDEHVGHEHGFMIDGKGFVGVVYLQFDTVTLQPDIQSRVLVDVWRQADGPAPWASDTALRAWVAVDHGHELPMLPNCAAGLSGPQLSEAAPMGQWTTLEVDMSGYSQATIKIGLEMAHECALHGDCDAQLYIDNLRVTGGGEPRHDGEVWCPTMPEPQFTEECCGTISRGGVEDAVEGKGSKSAATILLVASIALGVIGAIALANRNQVSATCIGRQQQQSGAATFFILAECSSRVCAALTLVSQTAGG